MKEDGRGIFAGVAHPVNAQRASAQEGQTKAADDEVLKAESFRACSAQFPTDARNSHNDTS